VTSAALEVPPLVLAAQAALPALTLSQYGSNLLSSGDIFPNLAHIMTPGLTQPEAPSGELGSPVGDVVELTEADREIYFGKATKLTEEEHAVVGWQSPPAWEFSVEEMRARECMSKGNQDHPARRLALEGSEQGEGAPGAVEPSTPKARPGGGVLDCGTPITPFAAPVVRAPWSKSSPMVAKHKSARAAGAGHPHHRQQEKHR
jgi:hypothetical protein